MSRATATRLTAAALAVGLSACGVARSVANLDPVTPPASEPVEVAPLASAIAVHEIAVAGDGRSVPIELVETDGGLALFMTEPTGIGRYAIDLDAETATHTETVPLDRYPAVAGYQRTHDRLWWTGAAEQVRLPQPSSDGDFPRGDLVVTTASTVAHSQGLRGTVRVCPAVASDRPHWLCNHEIRVLLPLDDGVVLGGSLTEHVGSVGAQPWLGLADSSGALTIERRLSVANHAWIDALARSDAGVLAVVWSGAGEPSRASFLLFRDSTLELINTASRVTPSWVAVPWSSAVAAPDGGFWVALATTNYQLTIVSIARDGSIAAEHTIAGAELPITSVQSLGLRNGQPWLLIADVYERPKPTLWAGRIDPATGEVAERHDIQLPTDFAPSRMLALDHGLLLAGRVGVERPRVVWIPLTDSDSRGEDERCATASIPDELLATIGVITGLRFVDTYSGTIDPSSFAALEH